jgi:hypothetical protein
MAEAVNSVLEGHHADLRPAALHAEEPTVTSGLVSFLLEAVARVKNRALNPVMSELASAGVLTERAALSESMCRSHVEAAAAAEQRHVSAALPHGLSLCAVLHQCPCCRSSCWTWLVV